MKIKLFAYTDTDSKIHRLSGLTKLICFLLITFSAMFTYDIRIITVIFLLSIYVYKLSKIEFKQIKLMLIYVFSFVAFNIFMTYFFAPEYGVELYGTRHEVIRFFGHYTLTLEQLLYQSTKVMKYIAVVPFGIIFFLTTNPSEFAASLNRIGLPYKYAYPVSLTLRYFPDVQRNYRDISYAQQARGLELSKKAGLGSRFKNALLIIIPLIFSTIERVDVISNAMDLRGFGKGKKRSWYALKAFSKEDMVALGISLSLFLTSIGIAVWVNGGRFYNPF